MLVGILVGTTVLISDFFLRGPVRVHPAPRPPTGRSKRLGHDTGEQESSAK